jgi:hypothetical protein
MREEEEQAEDACEGKHDARRDDEVKKGKIEGKDPTRGR